MAARIAAFSCPRISRFPHGAHLHSRQSFCGAGHDQAHPKRVAIYARVSTDDQTTENQLLELRQVAERAGWEVVETYVDHAISGSKGRDQRPAFDRLHKGAAARRFDLVMACSVDRLGRSLQRQLNGTPIFTAIGSPSSVSQA